MSEAKTQLYCASTQYTNTLDMHIAMDSNTFQKLTFTVQPAQGTFSVTTK